MSALALFPHGYTNDETAGEVVVDRIVPLRRGVDKPALCAVGRADVVWIEGWATCRPEHRPADGVFVNVDGTPRLSAVLGDERPDVATALGPGALRAGFRALLPIARLAPGRHSVSVSAINASSSTYRESPAQEILIVEPTDPAIPSDRIRLETVAEEGVDSNGLTVSVPYGSRVVFRGHARPSNGERIDGVVLIVDDLHVCEAFYGIVRSDLIKPHEPVDDRVGFQAVIGSELFGPGVHRVRVRTLSRDGGAQFESAGVVDLEVSAG